MICDGEKGDIMMSLFDVDELQEMYVKSRCREAEDHAEKRGIRRTQYENARKMPEDGKLLVEDTALYTGLTEEEVKKFQETIRIR